MPPFSYEPLEPPNRFEMRNGRLVRFWLGDKRWLAIYGYTRIELHEHPMLFPTEPFALEPFIYFPNGCLRHYGGRRFTTAPSETEFVDRTFALVESLARTDGIDEGL